MEARQIPDVTAGRRPLTKPVLRRFNRHEAVLVDLLRRTLGLFSAVIFVLSGAILLYGPISGPDTHQTARILVGAVLVSLGLVTLFLLMRDWLRWRRHYKVADKVEVEISRRHLMVK